MPQYVALLRGINVGGKRRLPMQGLCELMALIGCENAKTVIQSGNAVFRHSAKASQIEKQLSDAIETSYGFRPDCLVLSAKHFREVIEKNPLAREDSDSKHLHVWFLAKKATGIDAAQFDAIKTVSEEYAIVKDAFYLSAPDGIGRSKLAANAEKILGVSATARNARTAGKILALLDEQR